MVDDHVHVVSTDLVRYPVAQKEGVGEHWIFERPLTAERLLAGMDEAGVSKAVLVQPGPMLDDNRYVTDSAERNRGRMAAVCVVNEFAPDAPERLEYWVRERGAAGVRLSVVSRGDASEWLTDRALDPLWDAIERLGITAAIHVRWNGLDDLRTVLGRRPNIRFALDHLAHPMVDDGPPYEAVGALLDLAEFPNVHPKISTHVLAALAKQPTGGTPFIELLVRTFGANRLTWGSNSPRSEGRYADLATLLRDAVATLSEDDAAWVMGKTALSLYPALAG
jgi:predicted TIM-barrel fold metal-dependent hydrolase